MGSDGTIDLANGFVLLRSDGSMQEQIQTAGEPRRLVGFSIGVWQTDRPAPHNGEMHRDGDELLVVIEGAAVVAYDDGSQIRVGQGHAHIVARGRWHRVIPQGACRLLYATPGPNGEFRMRSA